MAAMSLFSTKKHCVRLHCTLTIYVLTMGADPAHWENIRMLPSPPEFTNGLPTPSTRALHFMKEGHLIVAYLDHGIV